MRTEREGTANAVTRLYYDTYKDSSINTLWKRQDRNASAGLSRQHVPI